MTHDLRRNVTSHGTAVPDAADARADEDAHVDAEEDTHESAQVAALQARVLQLENERDTLRLGLQTRQDIGFVTGVLAQRYGLQPAQAWQLLARVSQDLNVKVRQVVEVLLAVYDGQLQPKDAALAVRIADRLPRPS